jgi:hypothetical protein
MLVVMFVSQFLQRQPALSERKEGLSQVVALQMLHGLRLPLPSGGYWQRK